MLLYEIGLIGFILLEIKKNGLYPVIKQHNLPVNSQKMSPFTNILLYMVKKACFCYLI